ncbi:MAG: hypothetical protein HRU15_02155, partial [Planctomycetes bacterium]|nr:hypothetical protein [Planctomycetota bacterium]
MEPPDDPGPPGVPAYMVSFGDMITLLLTFFILLVAMADTQTAGLVGAGRGPLVPHVNAKGEPGIMKGHLKEHRLSHKRDSWWIPDQEGDPDQLEVVREKLMRELVTRFRADEASINYEKDKLVLRLPAELDVDENGNFQLSKSVRSILRTLAELTRRDEQRHIRINGDVGNKTSLASELRTSVYMGQVAFGYLQWLGVNDSQMSLW